jgi:hypothetical protein
MEKSEIAFTDNDIDILRIIPKYKDGRFDYFKFSVRNNFLVKSWEIKQKSPHIIRSIKLGDEITYHSSKKDLVGNYKPPVVHIKHKNSSKQDDNPYEIISSNVVDIRKIPEINLDTCFPLPLCKVEIKDGNITIFKKKSYHKILDIENLISSFSEHGECNFPKFNVIEIYITSKKFNTKDFQNMWPYYFSLWLFTTIDYLVNGPELSKTYLNDFESEQLPFVGGLTDLSFDQFNIMYKPYHNENVKENSISFYENNDYIALLASARIQLTDMYTKEKPSSIKHAFAFDLEWQLKEGKIPSRIEKDQRYRKFKKMVDKIKNLDLDNRKYVFCIPKFSPEIIEEIPSRS